MYTKTGHSFVAEKGVMFLMTSDYDNLFKSLITDEWCVKSDGHVESPQGYFAVVEIPEANTGERAEMIEACDPDAIFEWPGGGWYFTLEENSGLIFVYRMRGEAEALSVFEKTLAEFAKWDEF